MQSNMLWSNSFYRKISNEANLEPIIKASREQIIHDSIARAEDIQIKTRMKTAIAMQTEPSISLFLNTLKVPGYSEGFETQNSRKRSSVISRKQSVSHKISPFSTQNTFYVKGRKSVSTKRKSASLWQTSSSFGNQSPVKINSFIISKKVKKSRKEEISSFMCKSKSIIDGATKASSKCFVPDMEELKKKEIRKATVIADYNDVKAVATTKYRVLKKH